jgi:hypothetical protein
VIRSAGEGLGHIIIGSNQVSENPNWEESLTSASLQRSAERLRRPPSLLITNVRVAHSGADIFVAEQLLDFEQILSHVVEQDRGGAVTQASSRGGGVPSPPGERLRILQRSYCQRSAIGFQKKRRRLPQMSSDDT